MWDGVLRNSSKHYSPFPKTTISWQKVPIHLLWRHPLYIAYTLILSKLPPCSFCCLVTSSECITLLNNIMDLNLLNLGILVLTALCFVLSNKSSNLLKAWHEWHSFCYYSDLITQTQTHIGNTRTNRLTHINIYSI